MDSQAARVATLVLTVALLSPAVTAEEGEAPGALPPEAMQAWMKAISPGEHHAHMKDLVGKWKAEIVSYENPSQPQKLTGTSEYEMVLGDRYLANEMDSEIMGMPYTGMGLNGYDNISKKHTLFWVDTMGTWMTVGQGECADDHKLITIRADVQNPLDGTKMKAKMVTRMVGPDEHVFEYYVVGPDGSESKAMEITYTRM